MLSSREFQARMRDHSLDLGGGAALITAMAAHTAPGAAERLSIHRNNTMIGLASALADAYPVVARLVGQDCFDALAGAFVSTHPARRAPLHWFGVEFPAFLAGHPLGRDLAYLPDLARLEAAWQHAYHAAEATPLDPAVLTKVPAGRLGGMRLRLHPSHRFLASSYPVLAIWEANQQVDPPAVSLDQGGCQLLIVRPAADVMILSLSPGGLSLLMALAMDQPLDVAWDGAMVVEPDFQLDSELGRLLSAQIFTEVTLP